MLLVGLASPRALIRTQSSIRRHFGSSDRRTAILVEDSFSLFQQFGSFPASRYHRQTTTYENPTVSAASSLGHTAATTTTTFGVGAATTSALRGFRRAPTANFTQAGSRTMEVARPPSKVTPPRDSKCGRNEFITAAELSDATSVWTTATPTTANRSIGLNNTN